MNSEAGISVVTTARRGSVLLVTIDRPPVNALSVAVRHGLLAASQEADTDANVAAVLIVGMGRAYIAGTDIREFGKPPMAPSLPEVCNRLEACSKPVLVATHGPALGGGLEVALLAHYRLAMPDAKLGLPEVLLGLLPGAGGNIGWATRKRKAATRDPEARYVQIADRICERGWFGQKTGQGYYLYPEGARTGTPDDKVLAIIDAERQRAGTTPRSFSNEEIMRRYLADIRTFAQQDPLFWQPAALLLQLVEEGQDFDSLNMP